jgi:hypothetical protein
VDVLTASVTLDFTSDVTVTVSLQNVGKTFEKEAKWELAVIGKDSNGKQINEAFTRAGEGALESRDTWCLARGSLSAKDVVSWHAELKLTDSQKNIAVLTGSSARKADSWAKISLSTKPSP